MNVGIYRRAGFAISKRRFLQGVGGTAVGLLASGRIDRADAAGTAAHIYEIDRKQVFDIIVIGAGTAGLPAAIAAAGRGAKVLVIEKADQIGGTLNITGGAMAAAGTRLQKRKGIDDHPDHHYADIMRLSHGKADPAVTRTYVDTAASMIDWLEDNGLTFRLESPVKGSAHAGFGIARYQTGVEGGRSLIKAIAPQFLAAEAAGSVRVLLRSGAVELTQGRGNAVTGVIVEEESGQRAQYRGRTVILSTGGCMADKAVFEKYHGKPLYGRRVWPFATGDGFKLGLGAGGVIDGGQHYMCHRGMVMSDRGFPSPPFTNLRLNTEARKPWEIEVNKLGQRYVAEDATVDILERAQTDAPGMAAWVIFDQEIYEKAPPLMSLTKEQQDRAFETHPMFAKADTLDVLARRMGLPADAVAATVADYNRAVASGSDRFGRTYMPLPLVKPPFYAVEHLGSSVFSTAGLNIDGELRVLDSRRRPIPGLYAAGEVSGFWHTCGDFIVNGGALTPALAFGRTLGQRLPVSAA